MKVITIQCEQFTDNVWVGKGGNIVEGKKLPYPYHIDIDGKVLDQHFWQGDPYSVVGFQRQADVQMIDLWWDAVVKDPQSAVGMYPVFTEKGKGLYSYRLAVESVEVREVATP